MVNVANLDASRRAWRTKGAGQAENKPISKQTDIREDPERNENDSTLKYCQTPHDTPVSSGIMSETVFGSANQWNRKKSKITWPRFGVRRGRI